ncbi:hypothetical protein D3C85_1054400 [compost metagenome]
MQRAHQSARFIQGVGVDGLAQVAMRHGFRHADGLSQRHGNRLGYLPRKKSAQHDGQARQHQIHATRAFDDLLAGGASVHHLDRLNPGNLDNVVLQAVQKRQGFLQQALASGIALTALEQCAHSLE